MTCQLVEITCGNCGVVFAITPDRQEQLRQSHDTFYCPNGHPRHYPGKTKTEKRIEALEAMNARTGRRLGNLHQIAYELLAELRGCPVPGCDWRTRRHTHGLTPWSVAACVERIRGDREGHLAEAHGLVSVPDDATELVT